MTYGPKLGMVFSVGTFNEGFLEFGISPILFPVNGWKGLKQYYKYAPLPLLP